MTAKLLLEYSEISLLFVSALVIVVMWRKRLLRDFSAVACYLALLIVGQFVDVPILFFRRAVGLSIDVAYSVLFGWHVVSYVLEAGLMISVIYGVYSLAMKPLPGLQQMGKVIFRWVAGISLALGLVAALGPHVLGSGYAPTAIITTIIERVHECVGLLTLCLLLFVCFSIKSLGLSYRSHIFGVSLGIGIISTTQLVEAAWLATAGAHTIYSPIYLVETLGYVAAVLLCGAYFILPAPERKLILLPTTSPFFYWNRIAEALGDRPGHVAISGLKPSAAELKVLTALTKLSSDSKLAEQRVRAQEAALEPIAVNN